MSTLKSPRKYDVELVEVAPNSNVGRANAAAATATTATVEDVHHDERTSSLRRRGSLPYGQQVDERREEGDDDEVKTQPGTPPELSGRDEGVLHTDVHLSGSMMSLKRAGSTVSTAGEAVEHAVQQSLSFGKKLAIVATAVVLVSIIAVAVAVPVVLSSNSSRESSSSNNAGGGGTPQATTPAAPALPSFVQRVCKNADCTSSCTLNSYDQFGCIKTSDDRYARYLCSSDGTQLSYRLYLDSSCTGTYTEYDMQVDTCLLGTSGNYFINYCDSSGQSPAAPTTPNPPGTTSAPTTPAPITPAPVILTPNPVTPAPPTPAPPTPIPVKVLTPNPRIVWTPRPPAPATPSPSSAVAVYKRTCTSSSCGTCTKSMTKFSPGYCRTATCSSSGKITVVTDPSCTLPRGGTRVYYPSSMTSSYCVNAYSFDLRTSTRYNYYMRLYCPVTTSYKYKEYRCTSTTSCSRCTLRNQWSKYSCVAFTNGRSMMMYSCTSTYTYYYYFTGSNDCTGDFELYYLTNNQCSKAAAGYYYYLTCG